MSEVIFAPNPVLALKTIRMHLEQDSFGAALLALKEYGKCYAAYALAEVEKQKHTNEEPRP